MRAYTVVWLIILQCNNSTSPPQLKAGPTGASFGLGTLTAVKTGEKRREWDRGQWGERTNAKETEGKDDGREKENSQAEGLRAYLVDQHHRETGQTNRVE